jgi:hypothetical protein
MQKETTFKDVDIAYAAEVSVCFECGLEAGTSRNQGKPSNIELIGNQGKVRADSGAELQPESRQGHGQSRSYSRYKESIVYS